MPLWAFFVLTALAAILFFGGGGTAVYAVVNRGKLRPRAQRAWPLGVGVTGLGVGVGPDLEIARKKWISEATDHKERSKREESDYLRYLDHDGKFADFHSLRHSFITYVGKNGTDFKTTQDLARHSTPTLTARYTHGFREDRVTAVNGLPDLTLRRGRRDRSARGNDRQDAEENSALYSASKGALSCRQVQSSAENVDDESEDEECCNTLGYSALRGTEQSYLSAGNGIPERARTSDLRFRKPQVWS